jgi:hypothetical protein
MKAVVPILSILLAGVCLRAQQPATASATASAPAAATAVSGDEALSRAGALPPRASAADYQFRTQVGKVTIAAEFIGHGIPTLEGGPYTTEDNVVVEAALFGPPEMRIPISYQDFSLRINAKKTAAPGLPYLEVFKSLKDPDWEPPQSSGPKTTTSVNGSSSDGYLPRLDKMPIEKQRAMQLRVKKVSMGEGDRPLPQAGLLFFEFNGSVKSIHGLELIYNGPAGKATLEMRK